MDKSKITKAFRELRNYGYLAKQNFWCCQSCAWADLTNKELEKAVFYHRQDNKDLKENGSCYLAWRGNGQLIVETLRKHEIKVDWDGTNNSRIKIEL
jgi:hypothetical protein